MDAGWAQVVVAIGGSVIAAIIAVVAAGVAAGQARDARRQADAAHGDVEPTFHIEPVRDRRDEWALTFVARNFNRHAVLVDTVTITFPDTHLVLKGTVETRSNPRVAEGFVQEIRGRFVHRPLETLPGLPPGGENATDSRFTFALCPATYEARTGGGRLQTLAVVEGDRIEIGYAIAYKVLDGLDVSRSKSGKLSLVA